MKIVYKPGQLHTMLLDDSDTVGLVMGRDTAQELYDWLCRPQVGFMPEPVRQLTSALRGLDAIKKE